MRIDDKYPKDVPAWPSVRKTPGTNNLRGVTASPSAAMIGSGIGAQKVQVPWEERVHKYFQVSLNSSAL